MTEPPDLGRLSLNQITLDPYPVRDAVAATSRAGLRWIGLWRHKVAETGLMESARLVRETNLRVSSLCRGGWFGAATESERRKKLDDNRRAIDEAKTLGTDVLVLVVGPAPDRDLDGARAHVQHAIELLLPYAAENGVKLGLEPLHPMYAGCRSVVVTLKQANDMTARIDSPSLGVVIDVYHVWWDPEVYVDIASAAGRILGFHVCDWLVPVPDILHGRGMMGDGVIEIRRLRQAVESAGYKGPIEVEIFNRDIWSMPADAVLARMKEAYRQHV